MPSALTKPVRRVVTGLDRVPVVVTLDRETIGFRLRRHKQEYLLPLASVYFDAVARAVAAGPPLKSRRNKLALRSV